MKNPTIPPQLVELYYLRNVVIPWMRENPERVDFKQYESDCGTFCCMAAWYVSMRHGVSFDTFMVDITATNDWGSDNAEDFLAEVFCLDDRQVIRMFGPNLMGPLEARAALLDEIIAEKEKALVS